MSQETGKEFMRKTQYGQISNPPQREGAPQPPLELPVPAGASLIKLPDPKTMDIPRMDLRQAIEKRRTLRRYGEQPFTLQELAFLLWCTQGVQSVHPKQTFRTVPSAGARHAFETYVLANRVDGLDTGLYRYAALEHALIAVDLSAEIVEKLTNGCNGQAQVRDCAAAFFWTAVVERMFWRYVERGYRYLHLDAGHVCQNLYLAAEAIDSGVCAIAAYDDDSVNNALGIDGVEQFAIYVGTAGKRTAA